MKLANAGAVAIILAMSAIGVADVSAQQGPLPGQGREGGQSRLTEGMLQACVAKQEADTCSFDGADGTAVTGTCRAPRGRALACVPEGAGPVGGPDGGRQQ